MGKSFRRTGRMPGGGENILASTHLYVKRPADFPSAGSAALDRSGWYPADFHRRLARMGRHKTISDEDVLLIARDVFRRHGHTASTRQIADAAGISEAVLYQRFGSKDHLFFAAMHATGPDIEEILGPVEPAEDARTYLRSVVSRLGKYFGDVIPLALRVMTHPSFNLQTLERLQPRGPASLHEGLARRLQSLARRRLIRLRSPAVTARLLASLAHDWALGNVLAHGVPTKGIRELQGMVDIVWEGLSVSR
jgi:AcrR family transcriptional regulator